MNLFNTLLQIESFSNVISPDSIISSRTSTVAEMIHKGNYEELLDKVTMWSISFAGKLLLAFLLFIVGKWAIRKIHRLALRIISKRNSDSTLNSFLGSLIDVTLYVVLIVIIISAVGVQTVSFAAIIGAAGLAIGLSVKDNLSNFAGGIMILANKPFKIGDYIEAQSQSGEVEAVGILYTKLLTFDNKQIFIPNGPLSTGTIINYNSQLTRRVDINVSVEYGSNIEQVKEILLDLAKKHPKVLQQPAPFARMGKMNDSSIDFGFKVWTTPSDYWDVYFDLNEQVYTRLLAEGLNIPFPQMTIHMADAHKKQQQV